MDRVRALGLFTALCGTLLVIGLAYIGALRHPMGAAEETTLPEFAAIAAGLAMVTVGLLAVLVTFVER